MLNLNLETLMQKREREKSKSSPKNKRKWKNSSVKVRLSVPIPFSTHAWKWMQRTLHNASVCDELEMKMVKSKTMCKSKAVMPLVSLWTTILRPWVCRFFHYHHRFLMPGVTSKSRIWPGIQGHKVYPWHSDHSTRRSIIAALHLLRHSDSFHEWWYEKILFTSQYQTIIGIALYRLHFRPWVTMLLVAVFGILALQWLNCFSPDDASRYYLNCW